MCNLSKHGLNEPVKNALDLEEPRWINRVSVSHNQDCCIKLNFSNPYSDDEKQKRRSSLLMQNPTVE